MLGSSAERYTDFFNGFVGATEDGVLFRSGHSPAIVFLAGLIRAELSADLSWCQQGGGDLLQVCDPHDGDLCRLRVDPRADFGHTRRGQARSIGAYRFGLHVESASGFVERSTDLAGRGRSNLLQSLGGLRDHRQLRQLSDEGRRRCAEWLDSQQHERVFRGLSGGADHDDGRLYLSGSSGGHVWHVWAGVQRVAQCVCGDARRSGLWLRLVHDVVPGGDYQQHLDAPAGDRVSGGRFRSETPCIGHDSGIDYGPGIFVRVVFFQGDDGLGHV